MKNINFTVPKDYFENQISEAWIMIKKDEFIEYQKGLYALLTMRAIAVSNFETYEELNLLIQTAKEIRYTK